MLKIKYENKKELLYKFITGMLRSPNARSGAEAEGALETLSGELHTHRLAIATLLEILTKKNLITTEELLDVVMAHHPDAEILEN